MSFASVWTCYEAWKQDMTQTHTWDMTNLENVGRRGMDLCAHM